jgi:hypothetical protein
MDGETNHGGDEGQRQGAQQQPRRIAMRLRTLAPKSQPRFHCWNIRALPG